MTDSPSKEFHAFDSLMGKPLKVPKSTITERHAAYKKRPKPNKSGPKPKPLPPGRIR